MIPNHRALLALLGFPNHNEIFFDEGGKRPVLFGIAFLLFATANISTYRIAASGYMPSPDEVLTPALSLLAASILIDIASAPRRYFPGNFFGSALSASGAALRLSGGNETLGFALQAFGVLVSIFAPATRNVPVNNVPVNNDAPRGP